ncbi:sensor histidine kinase [Streptomyces sp. VRA16 Mangrove soil]|uniref:sensor histidine kinase n=1 Tax=Streptomyces sp. VRA16 Mangrove soil TaxID=2817434 RepID=UPI001A9FA38F|nr:histidine kinase [Streptomyces sp. VRA16 Mangrove soil]MBO1337976.1 ATP-binding protein [Streptomyces sp. VRA16 Mangrove soil]
MQVTRVGRRAAGVLLGCGTAGAGLLWLIAAGPVLLWPRPARGARAAVVSGARALAALERRRRTVFFGDLFPPHSGTSDDRIVRYVAARVYAGLLTAVVLGLVAFGAVLAGVLAVAVVRGRIGGPELLGQVALGGVLLFLAVQGLRSLYALDARLARDTFGPSERERLQRRIDELAAGRAAIVHAVDAERRRIERDLHDGLQQRLVALAMLLGRARRRSPEQAAALLAQAHEESGHILTELREVAWRVYPSALDGPGLREALAGVAERSPVPLRLTYEVPKPLPRPVETAAYFVVSEAVTNAAKHARATEIQVRLALAEGALEVAVRDDGTGGADPQGSGLAGLRGRVEALDGRLTITSPPTGPTTLTATLPC